MGDFETGMRNLATVSDRNTSVFPFRDSSKMTNSLGQVDTLSVELWLQDNEVLVQWGARPQVESVSST